MRWRSMPTRILFALRFELIKSILRRISGVSNIKRAHVGSNTCTWMRKRVFVENLVRFYKFSTDHISIIISYGIAREYRANIIRNVGRRGIRTDLLLTIEIFRFLLTLFEKRLQIKFGRKKNTRLFVINTTFKSR